MAAFLSLLLATRAHAAGPILSSQLVRDRLPILPQELVDDSRRTEVCRVSLSVDRQGNPYWVEVVGCTAPFVAASKDAAWQWVFPRGDENLHLVRALQFEWADGNPTVRTTRFDPRDPKAFDPPMVAFSDLELRKTKHPDVSAALIALGQGQGLTTINCRVHSQVDAKGKVGEVMVEDCPPSLVDPVQTAFQKWRYEPWAPEGKAEPFQVIVNYALDTSSH